MRCSGESRRWQSVAFLVAVLVELRSAHATEPARPQVEVECDELSQEARAAIEVRHLGDMADLPSTSGTLRLVCHTDAVIGQWLEGEVVTQRRSVSRGPTDSPTELLHWLASLLIDGRRQFASDPTTSAPVPLEGSPSAERIATASPSQHDEPPAVRSTAVLTPGARKEAPFAQTEASGEDSAPVAAPSIWGGSLGLRYQHWGKEIAGTVGPRVQIERAITHDWSGVVSVSWLWGTSSAGRLSASEGSLSAGVDYDVFDAWSVGLAGAVTVLALSTAQPNATRAYEVLPALDLTSQLRLPAPEWGAYLEAGLRAVPVSREVRLDKAPALHIPEVRALVSIGAAFTPP